MPGRPLNRRGEALRSAVLDAARAELGTTGFDGASMSAIAHRAGVHETSLYRRWQTRENLLLDALTDGSSQALIDVDTGSLAGDLRAIAVQLVAYLTSESGRALVRAAIQPGATSYAEQRAAFWDSRFEALRPILIRALARNEVDPDIDARLATQMLAGALHQRILLTGEPVDGPVIDALVDLTCRAVAPATPAR